MKKKLTKIIAMCALAGLMACSVGGCGKTEIDVMDGLTLEFNGVDGQGTARIADEYFWEDAAFEAAGIDGDSEDLSLLGRVMTIEEAVSYKNGTCYTGIHSTGAFFGDGRYRKQRCGQCGRYRQCRYCL